MGEREHRAEFQRFLERHLVPGGEAGAQGRSAGHVGVDAFGRDNRRRMQGGFEIAREVGLVLLGECGRRYKEDARGQEASDDPQRPSAAEGARAQDRALCHTHESLQTPVGTGNPPN